MPKHKMKAIGYIRCASSQTDDITESIAYQNEFINEKAREDGLTIVETFIDAGVSGVSLERPGLQEMLKSISSNNIDTLIVLDASRLSRNLSDYKDIIDCCIKSGVRVIARDGLLAFPTLETQRINS